MASLLEVLHFDVVYLSEKFVKINRKQFMAFTLIYIYFDSARPSGDLFGCQMEPSKIKLH